MNINKPGCYRLADFYSRFKIPEDSVPKPELEQAITVCPIASGVLRAAIPESPFRAPVESDEVPVRINLFHADNWKERLLGQWILQVNNLFFKEGALAAALKTQQPLFIENGLWEDEDFIQFWQQAQLTGFIPESNLKFEPEKMILLRQTGYDKNLWKGVSFEQGFEKNALVLNARQLATFFQRYECKEGLLYTQAGHLEQHAQQELIVNLTHDLSEDQWAEFLTQAQQLGIKLKVHCAPDMNIDQIGHKRVVDLLPEPKVNLGYFDPAKDHLSALQVIVSQDPDTSLNLITQDSENCQVLNISECNSAQVLGSLMGEYKDKKFHFHELPSALKQGLEEGKTMILTGSYSQELIQGLAPLLLNAQWPGKLVLLADNPESFSFVSQSQHEVTPEMQRACLGVDEATWQAIFKPGLCLASLRARLTYWRTHPNDNLDNAWQGMLEAPRIKKLKDLDVATSVQEAEAFAQSRIEEVEQALKQSPFVYLTGLTSVGKTTFVHQHLKSKTHFYQDPTQMAAWAADKTKERKILFLDEANLSARQWSELEGLFYKPKCLFVNGVYYPLDDYHEVIVAGNPLNYGDERTLASFFKRHGGARLFEPIPLATIYEDILKPLLPEPKELLVQPLLKVYQFLAELPSQDLLITPRELEMIALLLSTYQAQGGKDLEAAATYYAYHLAQPLVPKAYLSNFNATFPEPAALKRSRDAIQLPQDFTVTSSREELCELFVDLLALRTQRQQGLRPAKGGLGGLILEGEPGIGKSELAIHLLVSQGYSEKKYQASEPAATTAQKHFYRLPVSWPLEAKQALLLKAFHEGNPVIIDEINSAPMMEQLLNNLLMGTDLQGNPASIPGFMVIGTQNPSSMPGRQVSSSALFHRMITKTLKSYTSDEMEIILRNRGMDESLAQELVADYEKKRFLALSKGLSPVPCFRDLLSAADYLMRSEVAEHKEQYQEQQEHPKNRDKPAEDPIAPVSEVFAKDPAIEENIFEGNQQPDRTPTPVNYNFLLKAADAVVSILGVAGVIIAILALTAVISIGTAGLGTAIGVGIAAASYGLFRVLKSGEGSSMPPDTPGVGIESK